MYTQAQQQSLFPSCPMVPMPAGEPSVFYAFWTTETDPLGNDTVHSFCPVGVSNAIPVANQYHETMTQSYQESAPSPTTGTGTGGTGTLLKTVTTSLQYQADIPTPNGQGNAGNINILPTQITTRSPPDRRQHRRRTGDNTHRYLQPLKLDVVKGLILLQMQLTIGIPHANHIQAAVFPVSRLEQSPSNYLSPTTEKTYSGTSTSGTPAPVPPGQLTCFRLRIHQRAMRIHTCLPFPLSVANTDPTGNTTYSRLHTAMTQPAVGICLPKSMAEYNRAKCDDTDLVQQASDAIMNRWMPKEI